MKLVIHLLRYLLLAVLIITFIFPFYWMISTSLKSFFEAIHFPPAMFPKSLHFENYAEAWVKVKFVHYGTNSVIITLLTAIGQLLVCVPASYAFAKKKFALSGFFFALVLVDLMLPAQVTFVPIYVLLSDFGWLDTYAAQIIPFIYSSFAIFFMTEAFKQIPDELLDAAKLDQATELQLMVRIMLPITKPFILTLMLLAIIGKWNDYFWTLILTNSENVRTLPIAVKSLLDVGDGINEWNISMAGNVLLMAPVLLLYLFANRFIKNAFVYGGIK
ncbi:carbohydrate ABC transporter permease [Paenibacillus sp. OV219]|uniref:carbohydrate ABC transporter permease n=1 Tax=Paenibacillus sp. OV219 TaxID=1884377 RepID=UPI0008C9DD6E|nr:carbohydrate ABC transporter permease [Paenibacillus sp. OV219]SEO52211.1 carbohydrate ABC transporter membrane protein 2, CUT1 family [Paenibacillus sp. OV219]